MILLILVEKCLFANYLYNCFILAAFVFVIVEQDYDMAIKLYTDAINLFPFSASYYGNRSFAYIKTECYGYGLADANKALELDKTYVKVSDVVSYKTVLNVT